MPLLAGYELKHRVWRDRDRTHTHIHKQIFALNPAHHMRFRLKKGNQNQHHWAHWNTWQQTVEGTYSRPGISPSGSGLPLSASLMTLRKSHGFGTRYWVRGIIGLGSANGRSASPTPEQASGLPFEPGLYKKVTWKWLKNSNQCICHEFSCLVCCKVLWSVHTKNRCFAPSNQCHHSSNANLIVRSSSSPSLTLVMLQGWQTV